MLGLFALATTGIARSIFRNYIDKCAHLYIEIPTDIIINHIALSDPKLFSLLYRTCKTLNCELKKETSTISTSTQDTYWSQLWVYPDEFLYGIHAVDYGNKRVITEYARGKAVHIVHVRRSTITLTKSDESWVWSIHNLQFMSYKRGKCGNNNWCRIFVETEMDRKIIMSPNHSYSCNLTSDQNNYEDMLDVALKLISRADS